MKSKIFFFLLSFASLMANTTNPYILTDAGLLTQGTRMKIKEIGDEVKAKLGINLYVDIKGNNGINTDLPREQRIKLMKQKEQDIVKNLKPPYAVLALSIDQMYASILMSKDMNKVLDKNDILDGYVIPLLASKDKNSLISKASAATLNGYAQMADSIASKHDMTLKSSIGNEGKITGTIWRVFMYTMVVTGIVLYVVIILREKKYKNMSKKELEELEKNGK